MGNKRAPDGWHRRVGGEHLFWCDACAVPLLGKRCGRCGQEGRYLPLSPPGDVRPAMRQGISFVRTILWRDFRLPPSFRLPELILFNRIAGLDRTDQVIIEGRLFGTLSFDPVSRGHSLSLTGAGASMLHNAGARHLEFEREPGGRHLKGKNLPPSALKRAEAWAVPGLEVILAAGAVVAAGVMREGGGVRVRDLAPSAIRFSGTGATLDDAVGANREELLALENIAVREIGSVMRDRPDLPLTVSFSGGKDSLAVLELAERALESAPAGGGAGEKARGPASSRKADAGAQPLTILFSNTGIEFPETVEHIRALASRKGLRLLEKGAKESFWENLPRFGLPAKDFRWCCKVCKLAPMTELLAENYPRGCLTAEGRRRRESFARQGIKLVEGSPFVPGQVNLEPIRDWTALQVWLYIRWRRLRHNPLYDEDLERIGCWLCPSTLESEFETLRRTHPALHARWRERLLEEGGKQGLAERAISAGFWRWKALPPKMKELAGRLGLEVRPPRKEAPAALSVAAGISPCLTGGYTADASLRLPEPVPLERVANLLGMLGEVRFSEDMGVAVVRKGPASAKLFESGQIVVTGPGPGKVRAFLRDIVGVILRASRCSRCGICEKSCPSGAIAVSEAPVLDASRCNGCQKCARSCVLVRYADRLVEGLARGPGLAAPGGSPKAGPNAPLPAKRL